VIGPTPGTVINLRDLPVELGSVDPHAVQNNRELARDGDLGLGGRFACTKAEKQNCES
jgi:hypothetical protein